MKKETGFRKTDYSSLEWDETLAVEVVPEKRKMPSSISTSIRLPKGMIAERLETESRRAMG